MKRRSQEGMTLIELMVGVVVSMVLSLVVLLVMSTFEGRRRTLDSTADLDQVGSIALFQIDRMVRAAGTGLTAASSYSFGCEIYAANTTNGTLLPASSLPSPFDGTTYSTTSGVFRLAPVLIIPGGTAGGTAPTDSVAGTSTATSDVLVVMSSGNVNAQVPSTFTSGASSTTLNLYNTATFLPYDLLLLVDQQPASSGGIAPCMVSQADSGTSVPTLGTPTTTGTATTATTLTLSGSYYTASISGGTSVSGFSSTGAAINLGNLTSSSASMPPSFLLIGVGQNNTLYSYDLLQTTSLTTSQGMAEDVFEMHALYGVDTTGDGAIDSWVAPTGTYAYSALTAGTSAAATTLKTIKAVRVGLILRAALPERAVNKVNVSAGVTPTLFADLGSSLAFTRTLSSSETNFRYRTVEEIIPVRNNQF